MADRKNDTPERVTLRTMCAAAIDRFGGPEVLSIHQLSVPVPDAGEALIALHAAGVAGWDADIRSGWFPSGRPRFPLVLGTDGSGTIAIVGSRIRRFQKGDRVYAYSFLNRKGGFYAEYVAVPAENVAPIPKSLDLRHAGAIPATGLTALQGIDDALGIQRSESIIIHGAAGGVGSLALQFAKLRGARVLATASGEDGLALVRRLGADGSPLFRSPLRLYDREPFFFRRRRLFYHLFYLFGQSRSPIRRSFCILEWILYFAATTARRQVCERINKFTGGLLRIWNSFFHVLKFAASVHGVFP